MSSLPERDKSLQGQDFPRASVDEPPWSPALIEAIHEQKHCYVVADAADGQRMNAYGLLTLAVPDVERLTRELLTPVQRIEVLQRAGEQDTVFGVAVRRRLVDLRWSGDFNRGLLLPVQPDTAAIERDCGGDKDLFATTIIGAFDPRLLERLKPPRTERKAKTSRPQKSRPVVVTMSDVTSEAVQWLWWPYIAVGKVCMLDGDPGIGKTLLMTQIAASLSQGQPLPDQQGEPTLPTGGPQTTLLLSTEDGLADTLKPRLEAAGADCSKVHVLTGWLDPKDEFHHFTLQDMPVLEGALRHYQPRLVVIDPIQAYLGPIDMHRANETRPLLAALTRLAEQYRCAIVCIRHPGKPGQGGGKAIHRGLGSVDFIGAARTALFVEQHPTDPTQALMAQSKSNIGPLGRTQVFTKEHGQFRWCQVSRLSAELMAGSGRGPDPHLFLEVVCWLEKHLRPGVKAAKELEEELAEEGYRYDTIKRAKKALGIQSFQLETGWMWKLPDLPLLHPPLPLQPPQPPQPPLPPLSQNQGLTASGGRGEAEEAVVAVEAEVAVAGVVVEPDKHAEALDRSGENADQMPAQQPAHNGHGAMPSNGSGPPRRGKRRPDWTYPKPQGRR
jgi:AAA domain